MAVLIFSKFYPMRMYHYHNLRVWVLSGGHTSLSAEITEQMDLTDLLSSQGTEQVSEQGVGMEDASQKAGRGQNLGTGRRSRGLGRSPVPGHREQEAGGRGSEPGDLGSGLGGA